MLNTEKGRTITPVLAGARSQRDFHGSGTLSTHRPLGACEGNTPGGGAEEQIPAEPPPRPAGLPSRGAQAEEGAAAPAFSLLSPATIPIPPGTGSVPARPPPSPSRPSEPSARSPRGCPGSALVGGGWSRPHLVDLLQPPVLRRPPQPPTARPARNRHLPEPLRARRRFKKGWAGPGGAGPPAPPPPLTLPCREPAADGPRPAPGCSSRGM